MKIKSSKFNFCYKEMSSGKTVVFNTFSKCCVKLDKDTLHYIEDDCIEYNPGDDNNLDYLVKNGVLVNNDFDENEFLRYFYRKTCFSNEYMAITIAPTLSCNFDCPYCFEKKRPGFMSVEIQHAIVEYIKKKVQNGVRTLDISFYGGEPLICYDAVVYIASEIDKISRNHGAKVKFGIITNGYLLTEEMINFFEEKHFSVQITIDGMETMHNSRRFLKNGGETWQKIMSNLHLFNSKVINVYIRMNIDSENCKDFYALSKLIEKYNNPRMILYPSITEEINDNDTRNVYMSDSMYDKFILDEKNQSVFKNNEKSVPISNDVSKIPDKRCYHCTAELDNTCVIDELGNIYKCWDEVGIDEYKCFNLMEEKKANYQNIVRFVNDSFFDDEMCSNCVKLPICFGGCKFHKIHFDRRKCAYSDEVVKKYVENIINAVNKEKSDS